MFLTPAPCSKFGAQTIVNLASSYFLLKIRKHSSILKVKFIIKCIMHTWTLNLSDHLVSDSSLVTSRHFPRWNSISTISLAAIFTSEDKLSFKVSHQAVVECCLCLCLFHYSTATHPSCNLFPQCTLLIILHPSGSSSASNSILRNPGEDLLTTLLSVTRSSSLSRPSEALETEKRIYGI